MRRWCTAVRGCDTACRLHG